MVLSSGVEVMSWKLGKEGMVMKKKREVIGMGTNSQIIFEYVIG